MLLIWDDCVERSKSYLFDEVEVHFPMHNLNCIQNMGNKITRCIVAGGLIRNRICEKNDFACLSGIGESPPLLICSQHFRWDTRSVYLDRCRGICTEP